MPASNRLFRHDLADGTGSGGPMFFRALTFVLAMVVPVCAARAAPDRLLLGQIVSAPSAGELVAIYNPNGFAVDLGDYYLADTNIYYGVTDGSASGVASDFIARFPPGATIAPHATRFVSINGATNYLSAYQVNPDFELVGTNAAVADMGAVFAGSIGAAPSLTNAGEPVVLFYWNGFSELVVDVDYVYYGATQGANLPVNKTGITIQQSTYLPDTTDATVLHAPIDAAAASIATCRVDFAETGQVSTGGNGVGGADETSEPNSTTWEVCPFGVVPDRIFIGVFDA
jgi:hypothetical protein